MEVMADIYTYDTYILSNFVPFVHLPERHIGCYFFKILHNFHRIFKTNSFIAGHLKISFKIQEFQDEWEACFTVVVVDSFCCLRMLLNELHIMGRQTRQHDSQIFLSPTGRSYCIFFKNWSMLWIFWYVVSSEKNMLTVTFFTKNQVQKLFEFFLDKRTTNYIIVIIKTITKK